jgi:hypothetical protein
MKELLFASCQAQEKVKIKFESFLPTKILDQMDRETIQGCKAQTFYEKLSIVSCQMLSNWSKNLRMHEFPCQDVLVGFSWLHRLPAVWADWEPGEAHLWMAPVYFPNHMNDSAFHIAFSCHLHLVDITQPCSDTVQPESENRFGQHLYHCDRRFSAPLGIKFSALFKINCQISCSNDATAGLTVHAKVPSTSHLNFSRSRQFLLGSWNLCWGLKSPRGGCGSGQPSRNWSPQTFISETKSSIIFWSSADVFSEYFGFPEWTDEHWSTILEEIVTSTLRTGTGLLCGLEDFELWETILSCFLSSIKETVVVKGYPSDTWKW